MLTVKVTGEQGEGKTRLLEVVLRALREEGYTAFAYPFQLEPGAEAVLFTAPRSHERLSELRPYFVLLCGQKKPSDNGVYTLGSDGVLTRYYPPPSMSGPPFVSRGQYRVDPVQINSVIDGGY